MFNICQIETPPATDQAVKKVVSKDPLLKKVLQYTRRGWPVELPKALKQYASSQMELSVANEWLLLEM